MFLFVGAGDAGPPSPGMAVNEALRAMEAELRVTREARDRCVETRYQFSAFVSAHRGTGNVWYKVRCLSP